MLACLDRVDVERIWQNLEAGNESRNFRSINLKENQKMMETLSRTDEIS